MAIFKITTGRKSRVLVSFETGPCDVIQAGLWPQPPECWSDWHMPSCSASSIAFSCKEKSLDTLVSMAVLSQLNIRYTVLDVSMLLKAAFCFFCVTVSYITAHDVALSSFFLCWFLFEYGVGDHYCTMGFPNLSNRHRNVWHNPDYL